MKKLVYKSYEYKSDDVTVKGNTICGYFAIFNNIDSDGDVFQPGAFAKTIAENGPQGKGRVLHLYAHNRWDSLPIGKLTLLKEDAKGLYFESEIVETDFNKDILAHYKAGTLKEHSVGFYIINSRDEMVNGKEVRYITEVKLLEGSTVLWGANEEALVTGIKSFNNLEKELIEIKSLLQSLTQSADYNQQQPESKEITTEDVIKIFSNKLNL